MDKALLNGLTDKEKELFKKEYSFIKHHLPLKRRFSSEIDKIIVEGLVKLVKRNSGLFINNLYIDFIESSYHYSKYPEVIFVPIKPDTLTLYKEAFIFEDEAEIYLELLKYMDYYQFHASKDGIPREYQSDDRSKVFNSVNKIYHHNQYFKWWIDGNIGDESSVSFLTSIINYLLVYFLANNDLYNQHELYRDICNYLFDNIDFLLDHYNMNYVGLIAEKGTFRHHVSVYMIIINDLINRFNNQKGLDSSGSKTIL